MSLSFYLARLRNDESRLIRWSTPKQALLDDLRGARVAIVGNARALGETRQGARIDAADLVIRLNGAPIPSPLSHGTRTTWLATSVPVPRRILAARAPARILWMTHVRKRLPLRLARDPRFYLNRRADWEALRTRLAAPPTTGLMAIDFVARSAAAEIALYGFDFFASLSLTGHRTAAQVPHDFTSERAFVENLMQSDPRIRLIPPTAAD